MDKSSCFEKYVHMNIPIPDGHMLMVSSYFVKYVCMNIPLPDARWAFAHDNSDHDKVFCRCMKPFHEKNGM